MTNILKQIKKTNNGGNNIAKFIDIQREANILILEFKWHESIILLMIIMSAIFDCNLSCNIKLNTTCDYNRHFLKEKQEKF